MTNVIFKQATIGRNENCIALFKRGDETHDADIFQFSDDAAFSTASDICDALAENEYSDNEICDGTVGNAYCLFLFEGYASNTAKIFTFDNERDLNTACQMATRFVELDNDDETTDSEE